MPASALPGASGFAPPAVYGAPPAGIAYPPPQQQQQQQQYAAPYGAPPAGAPWGTAAPAYPTSPFGPPGGAAPAPTGQPYGGPPNPYAMAAPGAGAAHGDRAGEHRHMQRGRYSAWPYVIIAFLMQAGLIGTAFGGAAYAIGGAASMEEETAGMLALSVGALIGLVAAWFTFRDRWRCIEAFSSRFCSGLMNFSILYVPLVALVYGNVRGIKKWAGR
jgi:hypothetical protein